MILVPQTEKRAKNNKITTNKCFNMEIKDGAYVVFTYTLSLDTGEALVEAGVLGEHAGAAANGIAVGGRIETELCHVVPTRLLGPSPRIEGLVESAQTKLSQAGPEVTHACRGRKLRGLQVEIECLLPAFLQPPIEPFLSFDAGFFLRRYCCRPTMLLAGVVGGGLGYTFPLNC